MGKLIMPKHTGERVYFQTPLKVYYDANDWVSMRDFADRLFDELVAIGKEHSRNSDNTHYTKCAQLPRYFGLVKRQSAANDADAKITPRGIKVYEALIADDMPSVHAALVEAMETMTFGRDNEGCGSDSDVEPLGVFFRCAYALDGLTGKEFGYVLGELHEHGKSIREVQAEVLSFRNRGVPPPVPAQSLASNLADCKTLKLFKELGFIVENVSGRMVVNPEVDVIYHDRLGRLRITNAPPLKKPFKKWLEANGYGVSIETYPRSIEAISMPLSDPMSKTTGSWEGMYEYLFAEKPSRETFTVTGRLDFDARYHKLSLVLDKDVVPPVMGIDPGRHQELIDYTLKSGNSIDKGRLYCAYNAYKEFLTWFDAHKFEYGLREVQEEHMINTILAAIRTKPFILLAGISGTGKSRIVRQLARGCCPEKKDGQPHPLRDEQKPGNYELIPVRPNWHDSTELMGYVTRITGTNTPKYVLTPFVKFLVKAWLHKDVPFFLCLDEMNLAPVEQYFAEYLSKIETRKLSGGDIVTDVLVEFPDEILDSALSEISREIPLVATTKQEGGDAKPETRKRDKDSLYKLWDEFLADWPISRLREMGLEEYTKAGSTATFTYALEAKLANLGSIWGGSAFKFGIFSRDPNGKLKDYNPNSKQIGTNEYAWYRKFGLTKDAAWNAVKEKIVSIAEAAANGDFAVVEKIDFPHVVKWKVAFLYQDRKNIKIVDIFKKEWVVLLTSGMPRNATFAERYLKLNEDRKDMDVFEWDDKILTKRRAELLGSDDDFDSDEEEESTPADTLSQSPVLEMIKRDKGIRIPPNLVVMGTVNMDETTCSFSRKVLDRAMSFELNDVEDMYAISENGDPDVAWGAFNCGGVNRAKQTYVTAENLYAETDATKKAANMAIGKKVLAYLKAINAVLDKTPFKVAYRTRNEMMLYCVERGGDLAKALDEVTGMKILSRIEGDENAVRVTNKLVDSAAVVPTPIPKDAAKNLIQLLKLVILKQLGVVDGTVANAAAVPSAQEYETLEGKYKICAAKLDEMNDRLLSGYTGFWR